MTPRTTILIPVKATTRAKGRLGALMDQPTRTRLALVMFEDVLDAVVAAVGALATDVVVATSDPDILALARSRGTAVLPEDAQRSESASVDAASRVLAQRTDAVLTIPADVPALRTDDLAGILAATADCAVVMVPARGGKGTNAIWRRPPDAIPSRFGFDSFRKHQAEAESRGLAWRAVEVPRLAVDLDEPDDVVAFLAIPGQTRTRDFLEECGVASQLVTTAKPEVSVVGLLGIPEVSEGDDLVELILDAAVRQDDGLRSGDVLVIAQKIVSKSEGRVIALDGVKPTRIARDFAEKWGKDPRQVEVVLQESARIVRMDRGVIIAETKHGFVCANAGVDASNVPGECHVCLLPLDPDESAQRLVRTFSERVGIQVAVLISDTFGRPWREGLTNVAIGAAGLHPLVSYIGQRDPHGHLLRATELAVADELAAAAGLVMRKLDRIPVVRIRGYRYEADEGRARSLIRPAERDLFR